MNFSDSQPVPPIRPSKRYVVAVHGIGDQYENATIQSVVSAFAGFFNYPAGVPLGAFRKPRPPVETFNLKTPRTTGALPVPPDLADISFVEIYWADIPREQQKKGYTIEETKAWARTVVARLRARYEGFTDPKHPARMVPGETREELPPEMTPKEYRSVADALEEMIETFAVLGNLLWIAEKAGFLKFNLDELLTNYLGDVQIVADFDEFRIGILKRLKDVLDAVGGPKEKAEETEPEIYIVAHSEGTVVAFMGLLQGMVATAGPASQPPDWFKYVRGFMTFGSPIDKHVVLWPDIWEPVTTPRPEVTEFYNANPEKKIHWKNYYDYGDPVGFKLDTTRDWLNSHGWSEVFSFHAEKDDHGFSRYPMPGQAHNDYWKDRSVFGHFIENVVGLRFEKSRYADPPKTRRIAAIVSYIIPYLLIYVLSCLGGYFIYKATESFVKSASIPAITYLLDVLGIGALLAGMIVLARIPKLTRRLFWWFTAVLIFAICASGYYFIRPEVQHWQAFGPFENSSNPHASGLFVLLLAFLTAGFAGWLGRRDPGLWKQGWRARLRPLIIGTRPLVFLGALQVAAMVIFRICKSDNEILQVEKPSLWPVVLSAGAFLYLWWLAILIFDLVFVWHRYIRWAVAPDSLRAMRRARKQDEGNVSPRPS